MSIADLSVFFRPKGVAVIGASRDPGKLGNGVIHNLMTHHYDGAVYPVNPHASEVLGLNAYPSVTAVPDPVDLAVIVVPAHLVEQELDLCGRRGLRAVIIVSGGFRESGAEGIEREERIKQIARRYGIALLGPNCIGTIDTHTPINTTFITAGHPRPGEIALVSQSGAIAAAIIDWARGSGVGFSRLVSLGNQAGVTEAEMLEAVANDTYTRVVTAYIEGVANGRAFVDAATRVAQMTPIVTLKVGRGRGGAKAIASHTGALAGTEAAYDAAFRRAGVLRATSLEEMLDWARALAWQPLPNGNRVGVLTNAGGPGIMAVDALEAAGMALAPLTEQTKDFLRQRLPPAASIGNPIDILAGSGPATYALCLDALLADETVDAVVVIAAPQDWFAPLSLAEVVGEVGNSPLGRRKPVLAALMGLASTSDATQVLHRRHIPNFAFPERLGSTLAAMWQRKRWLDAAAILSPPLTLQAFDPKAAQAAITAGISNMRRRINETRLDPASAGWMPLDQVENLLRAYGIRMPRAGLTPSVDEAFRIAANIGYPVAMKLAGTGLIHKTDIGGVILNIDSPESLERAFWSIAERVKRYFSDMSIVDGVYIQQMVRGEAEIIIGMVYDPQFGPLVMAGGGGTQVELLRDVTFEIAPLTRLQAAEMLERTTAGQFLSGYRGKTPADREAVIEVIQLLAQLFLDWPQIAEVEINPLIVLPPGDGAYAVDVRVRLIDIG